MLLARLLELPQGIIERHQALLERVDGCLGAVCQLQFGVTGSFRQDGTLRVRALWSLAPHLSVSLSSASGFHTVTPENTPSLSKDKQLCCIFEQFRPPEITLSSLGGLLAYHLPEMIQSPQFGEDIGDMGLDCLLSKDKFNSNLVIRAAMCKVGEDLQFARREFIQEYLARLLHFA